MNYLMCKHYLFLLRPQRV